MGSKKDIGKAYKEQLEGYSSSPHNRVWENIEAELKKSKRRVFPIWKILTGLGIILLISSLGVYTYYQTTNAVTNTTNIEQSQQDILNSDSLDDDTLEGVTNTSIKNTQTLTNTQNETKSSVTDREPNLNSSNSNQNTSVANVSSNNNQNTSSKTTTSKSSATSTTANNINGVALKNTKNATVLSATKSSQSETPNQTETHSSLTKNNTITQDNNELNSDNVTNSINDTNTNEISTNLDSNAVNDTNLADEISKVNDSLELETNEPIELDVKDLIEDKKTKDVEKPEKLDYPLTLSAYVSPTYTNVFGNSSSIDPRLDNNKVAGRINFNYGIAATVKISEKSSLRFGIGASQISYTIKAADTTSTSEEGGFLRNGSGYSNLTVNSQAFNSVPNIFSPNSVIDFQQKFKYLETPLDYIYHLKNDTKIHIDLVGGFSALFLSNQSIIAKDRNGNSLEIGEVENLNKTNFSFNLGSNFSYFLSEKLSLNAAPTFKYYLSTYNDNVDSKPYSFGLRFGISYRF